MALHQPHYTSHQITSTKQTLRQENKETEYMIFLEWENFGTWIAKLFGFIHIIHNFPEPFHCNALTELGNMLTESHFYQDHTLEKLNT